MFEEVANNSLKFIVLYVANALSHSYNEECELASFSLSKPSS